jgi:hypothetical protein
MKIDQGMSMQPMPQASDSRRQLSMEATFDRTMEQLESAMWPGAKVGSQPTTHLPGSRSAAGQGVALSPLPFTEAPPAATAVATSGTARSMHAYAAMAPRIAGPNAAQGTAAQTPTPGMALPATVTSRAVATFTDEGDAPVSSSAAPPTRDEPVDDDAAHLLTWIEGAGGPELVIRQSVRHGAASDLAREALAQIRRHGLLPGRVTVNGVTTDNPYRHGAST